MAAAVVTHVVYARLVGDEEWRSFYGSAWSSEANARMETADTAMFEEFGIDFRPYAYSTWTSSPNAGRTICNLWSELRTDIAPNGADVVVAFSNNPLTGSTGCAGGDHTVIKLHGATTAERVSNVWKTAQHEFSHFFGAPDRYPDPNNQHPMDVMESQYAGASYWCSAMAYNDWYRVAENAGEYD